MSAEGLEVSGRSVKRKGAPIAYLTYAGKVITVHRFAGERVIGRLARTGNDLYEAWTAEHPATSTPADIRLTPGVPLTDAVAAIVENEGI